MRQRGVETLSTEEPDDLIGHVRICGGAGWATAGSTRKGIYDGQVWDGDKPSRRAMHEAGFEAGRDGAGLLPRHRAVLAPAQQGRGREVLG